MGHWDLIGNWDFDLSAQTEKSAQKFAQKGENFREKLRLYKRKVNGAVLFIFMFNVIMWI